VESKFDYFVAEGSVSNNDFSLIKPTTYVNNSGLAAKDFIDASGVDISDFLVVSDDVNLEPGKLRIRKSGGDGGHNGLYSIIYHLKSEDFPRLRFGIGKDFEDGSMANYVLSKFDEKEEPTVNEAIELSMFLIESFIVDGIQGALNLYSKEMKNHKANSDTLQN
jgi:PTH1 family peptidyl-tRNA hydrolase